jgi:alpha-methylacyl-CoA racemase
LETASPPPPLRGLRVLDLSRLLPGPFCTLVLSDLGASVDKLEDPHVGDYLRVMPPLKEGLSGRFNALNRDKRSLCLDLKRPEGRAALLRVISRYDVLVESFRPGVMERLGLGWEALSENNPRLVMCSISGYGQTGPYRDRAGHDLNYIAVAGVLGLTGAAAM